MTTTETELPRTATASEATADRALPELQRRTAAKLASENPPRDLITSTLFCELTDRVAAVDGYDRGTAERITEQALAFLVACSRYPNRHLVPSRTVDAGWHAFLLHTADYAEFCERIAGRFIHHRPDGTSQAAAGQQAIGVTIAAMRDAGLPVDPDLWVPAAECSQCYQGCSDDPRGA